MAERRFVTLMDGPFSTAPAAGPRSQHVGGGASRPPGRLGVARRDDFGEPLEHEPPGATCRPTCPFEDALCATGSLRRLVRESVRHPGGGGPVDLDVELQPP